MIKSRVIITLSLVAMLVCSVIVMGADFTTIPEIPTVDTSGPTYKVTNIVDGDTIDIMMNDKTTRVRLIGIDTPETVDPRKKVEYYGNEASRFNTNLLLGEGVYVEQEPSNTVDIYGRSLYYLYRAPDGLFVNLEIVRQGYGHTYTTYPFKYIELFRYYEKKASSSGKGLWGAPIPVTAIDNGSKPTPEPNSDDTIVYITVSGKKYHKEGCSSLRSSKIAISKSEAIKRGYTVCSKCNP